MTEKTGALQISGTIYINTKINGVFQGLKEVLGLTEISVTPKSKSITQISKDKATHGQVTAVAANQEPAELKIKFSAFNSKMMALAMMGESSTLSGGANTVTDEVITAKLDCFVALANRNITAASVVLTNSGATTTYVEGTDYTVNYAIGMIQCLSTGAITAAQSLKVDYANAAYAGFATKGATKPDITAYILIDGKNLADDENVEIEIDEAHLSANSAVDFMSDKFSELDLTGFMVTQSGKTDPYRIKKWQTT